MADKRRPTDAAALRELDKAIEARRRSGLIERLRARRERERALYERLAK